MQHNETFAKSLSMGLRREAAALSRHNCPPIPDYAPFLVLGFRLDELEAL